MLRAIINLFRKPSNPQPVTRSILWNVNSRCVVLEMAQ